MSHTSRNAPKGKGIVERTLKNLQYVQDAHARGDDVHVVAHLVTSLLGLVVLPWEKGLKKNMKDLTLERLKDQGWPEWNTSTKEAYETLGCLIRHLRNATAHGRYTFSSESKHLSEVTLTVKDTCWKAEIQADRLYVFCLHFIKCVYGVEPNQSVNYCKKCFP